MKRFLKALTTLSVFMLLVVLTSCGSNKFYNEWSKAGAEIEKENIFEYIELEQVGEKIAAGETFVLIYASSENDSSVSTITSFQAQYDYLCTKGEEVTIYVLDSTDFDKSSERKEAKETLKVSKAVPNDGSPLIVTYEKGVPVVESNYLDKIATQEFVFNGKLDCSSLCSYIFRELLVKAE